MIILISYKVDFKVRNISMAKEAHFIMIKIHQAYVTILDKHVYIPRNRASK